MGESDPGLAEAGGNSRASRSKGAPRKSCEPVLRTTSVDNFVLFDIIAGLQLLIEQGGFTVVEMAASTGPAEVKAFPECFLKPFGEKLPSTMLFGSFSLRALSFLRNSAISLLAAADGSKGASGSEGVPRKSCETFRGTTSVDDTIWMLSLRAEDFLESLGKPRRSTMMFGMFRFPEESTAGRLPATSRCCRARTAFQTWSKDLPEEWSTSPGSCRGLSSCVVSWAIANSGRG